MELSEYLIQINKVIKNDNSSKEGELTIPLVKKIAALLKISLDAPTFCQYNFTPQAVINTFVQNTNLFHIINTNAKLWGHHFGEFPILELIKSGKTFSRIDWCLVLYVSFANKTLFAEIKKTFSETAQKLWDILIWAKELTDKEVEKIIGQAPITITAERDRNKQLVQKATCLSFINFLLAAKKTNFQNHTPIWIFSLPIVIRLAQKKITNPPKEFEFLPIQIDNKDFIFETELLTLEDILKVGAYSMQGNIKTTNTGRANLSSVNKLRKTLGIKEFYENNDQLGSIRTSFLANWILLLDNKINIHEGSLSLLDGMMLVYKNNNTDTFELTSTHLKGLKQLQNSYYSTFLANDVLATTLSQLPVGEWIATEDIEKYMEYREVNIAPTTQTISANYLKYEGYHEHKNIIENGFIPEMNYYRMVDKAHLYGSLFMLASLGIFDINYTTPNLTGLGKTYFSDWDGLQAIRLTALGAYLLGQTTSYQMPETKEKNPLVFDEQSLLILGESDDKLVDTLLLNYAQKVSNNRYLVTAQTFLKDCNTIKEIEQKIQLFRQSVNQKKLLTNWENFFLSLRHRASDISQISWEYEIFQLQANNKELLRLIAQDKQLQKIVIKAEGFKVLVLKKELLIFKNKLREWGYILG